MRGDSFPYGGCNSTSSKYRLSYYTLKAAFLLLSLLSILLPLPPKLTKSHTLPPYHYFSTRSNLNNTPTTAHGYFHFLYITLFRHLFFHTSFPSSSLILVHGVGEEAR